MSKSELISLQHELYSWSGVRPCCTSLDRASRSCQRVSPPGYTSANFSVRLYELMLKQETSEVGQAKHDFKPAVFLFNNRYLHAPLRSVGRDRWRKMDERPARFHALLWWCLKPDYRYRYFFWHIYVLWLFRTIDIEDSHQQPALIDWFEGYNE